MGYDSIDNTEELDVEGMDDLDTEELENFDMDDVDTIDDVDAEELDDFDMDDVDDVESLDDENLDDLDSDEVDDIDSAETTEEPEMSWRDSLKVENWKSAPGFENMDSFDTTDSSSDDVEPHGDDGERIRDFER